VESAILYFCICQHLTECSYRCETRSLCTVVRFYSSALAGELLILTELDASLCHDVQIGSGALPAACSVIIAVHSVAVKRSGRQANHSAPLISRLRMCGAVPPLLHTSALRSA
jgi:hypothetical protein